MLFGPTELLGPTAQGTRMVPTNNRTQESSTTAKCQERLIGKRIGGYYILGPLARRRATKDSRRRSGREFHDKNMKGLLQSIECP